MTSTEFIQALRRGISEVGDYHFVNETIEYYQNYIATEIRKGRTEEDVMSELGDPRLIAKSILASKNISHGETVEDTGAGEKEDDKVQINTRNGHNICLPVWALKLGGIVLAVLLIFVVGAITIKLMPVIVVAVLCVLFYRFIRDNFIG